MEAKTDLTRYNLLVWVKEQVICKELMNSPLGLEKFKGVVKHIIKV